MDNKKEIIAVDKSDDYANIPVDLNSEAFVVIKDFMRDAKLTKIGFLGGALIRTKMLKEEKVIDDYDLNLIGIENKEIFESSLIELEKSGYKKQIEDGITTTNLKTINYFKDGKSFDYSLKKDLSPHQKLGTFDIDTLSVIVDTKKDMIIINNISAIESLKNRVSQLEEKTTNLPRVIARMLIFVAKYDTNIFYLGGKQTLPFFIESKIKEEIEQNKIALKSLNEIPESAKGECLAKFLKIIPRVKNPDEYIKKVNSSNLVYILFPNLSDVLNDENFLNFLKKEKERQDKEKLLNNDVEVFNFLYLYSKNKKGLLEEFGILEKTRGTKKSDVIIRISQIESQSLLTK